MIAKRLIDRASKGDAGINDIYGAEAQALVDLVFIAELGSRENLDFVTATGPLLDLVGCPQGLRVIRLGGFVDVSPFEFGLGRGRSGQSGKRKNDRRAQDKAGLHLQHDVFLPWDICRGS